MPQTPDAGLTGAQLKQALREGGELAILDLRENGAYAKRHLLYAVSAPLWRLELIIAALVPRRSTRIVLIDGDGRLLSAGRDKLARLGYTEITFLEGGTDRWEADGHEVFSGTNVPGKAFGEVLEHQLHTPWIDAGELQQRIARGDDLVVVDSRTSEEFDDFSIPGAYSLPGAELVYRIGEVAPSPNTLVVVNCAGRTRSIVGAQTLINAKIPNQVVSLKNGTMDWLKSGATLNQGVAQSAPSPAGERLQAAQDRAAEVAHRAGVRALSDAELATFTAERDNRTLYLFDVRSREEYLAGHLRDWRWAPGGQLVQASDEYAATRGARIVLADWDGVRARTTAAWLAQIGGFDVFTWAPGQTGELETGPERRTVLQPNPAPRWLAADRVAQALATGAAEIFDIDNSLAYRKAHMQGARFSHPEQLAQWVDKSNKELVVLTSSDGVLAGAVAAELTRLSAGKVAALLGGTTAWKAAGLPLTQGREGVLSGDDDVWYGPYVFDSEQERNRRFDEYLDWELGLVEQLQRDGTFAGNLTGSIAAA
ncbi:MAG: Thiosulfate sulfurtransferase GlpE [Herbaspirillum frisingense]|uniref:Thiosulfate sulfurtransferase GlpE n=1 Tax=Herbaspirillum frisingense TaxID=92645 RepID=A0A7V8JU12_9BURK|nr:MAG: Thiosulfate sulfurtransferase GlpE [Herbaspirillum frisingense]